MTVLPPCSLGSAAARPIQLLFRSLPAFLIVVSLPRRVNFSLPPRALLFPNCLFGVAQSAPREREIKEARER